MTGEREPKPSPGGTKVTFALFGFLGLLFVPMFLAAVALGSGPFAPYIRDTKREFDKNLIRVGLFQYYQEYALYPSSLVDLIPRYIPDIPIDPKTRGGYEYQTEAEGKGYRLCLRFEKKPPLCLSAESEK